MYINAVKVFCLHVVYKFCFTVYFTPLGPQSPYTLALAMSLAIPLAQELLRVCFWVFLRFETKLEQYRYFLRIYREMQSFWYRTPSSFTSLLIALHRVWFFLFHKFSNFTPPPPPRPPNKVACFVATNPPTASFTMITSSQTTRPSMPNLLNCVHWGLAGTLFVQGLLFIVFLFLSL